MHFDAIVIGGSFAGLSAALYVARGRRPVCVIDSGIARNRFAAASHGVFGHDGRNPQALLGEARQQLQAYANARFIAQPAISAQANGDGFQVQLADGQILTARKLVLAFGVTDVLPDIPGLAAGWGVSVLHCPYCHGYEFSGRRLGVLYAGPGSYRHVRLIAEWGPTTLYLNGETELDPGQLAALEADDITIERDRIAAALGDNGQLSALQLEDGRQLPIDALYIHTQPRLSSPLAEQLGCAIDETPFGPVIQTDAGKQTSVPGVYAAGDIARAPHNATWAAADGVTAGVSLHQALVFP